MYPVAGGIRMYGIEFVVIPECMVLFIFES